MNILHNRHSLDALQSLDPSAGGGGGGGLVAQQTLLGLDAVRRALEFLPSNRPTAQQLLKHAVFWDRQKQLQFLVDVADRIEKLEPAAAAAAAATVPSHSAHATHAAHPARGPKGSAAPVAVASAEPAETDRETDSELLRALETESAAVLRGDWRLQISAALQTDLRRYRTYRGEQVRDLVRAIRNKKHHFRELPIELQHSLGQIPDQFVEYFTARFPRLLPHLYLVIERHCRLESLFAQYY